MGQLDRPTSVATVTNQNDQPAVADQNDQYYIYGAEGFVDYDQLDHQEGLDMSRLVHELNQNRQPGDRIEEIYVLDADDSTNTNR